MNESGTRTYIVDNGSLRPQAVFALRKLAKQLSDKLNQEILPASVLHSHKIEPNRLEGEPALIVKQALEQDIQRGVKRVVLLPLFLGPSLAITEYLPELVAEVTASNDAITVHIAKPLYGSDIHSPDPRLAQILADHVVQAMQTYKFPHVSVALVDHGSPYRPVNIVRNAVAAQLRELLDRPPYAINKVIACSMERRPGEEYAFNEPLLENIGCLDGVDGHWLAAMFFLLPGRHAGEGGDVVQICASVVAQTEIESLTCTQLLAEHPLLLDILTDRLKQTITM